MLGENFWSGNFNQLGALKFQCPTCEIGLLITKKEKKIEESTKYSENYRDDTGDSLAYEGHFALIARCNNIDCQEIMTIVGETEVVEDGYDDSYVDPFANDYSDYINIIYKTEYKITYTNPSIRLIKIPIDVPTDLIVIIEESFSLFLIDEVLCGNKIIMAIEKILDTKKIKKTLNLYQRIEEFKRKKPELTKNFLLLKCFECQGVVTVGSNKNELMDAYKVLEMSLFDLFDKTTQKNEW